MGEDLLVSNRLICVLLSDSPRRSTTVESSSCSFRRMGRPCFQSQYMMYQEHLLRFNEPPEKKSSCSHVWAAFVSDATSSSKDLSPLSAIPRAVSSTNASTSRLCVKVPSGDRKLANTFRNNFFQGIEKKNHQRQPYCRGCAAALARAKSGSNGVP